MSYMTVIDFFITIVASFVGTFLAFVVVGFMNVDEEEAR